MAILAPAIGFLAANAGTIGAVASAGSAIFGGITAKQQADHQSSVERANAEIANRNAMRAETEGQHQRDQLRLSSARDRARGRVAFAGGGVQLGAGGSAGSWEEDLDRQLDIDVSSSMRNAQQVSDQYTEQGQQHLRSAAASKASGRASLAGGFLSAGGSILGAASKTEWGKRQSLRANMIRNNNAYFRR